MFTFSVEHIRCDNIILPVLVECSSNTLDTLLLLHPNLCSRTHRLEYRQCIHRTLRVCRGMWRMCHSDRSCRVLRGGVLCVLLQGPHHQGGWFLPPTVLQVLSLPWRHQGVLLSLVSSNTSEWQCCRSGKESERSELQVCGAQRAGGAAWHTGPYLLLLLLLL